jgi:transposase InsO family protein
MTLRSANKSPLRVLGEIDTKFKVRSLTYQLTIQVIRGLSHSCLFGKDFLFQLPAKINLRKQTIEFKSTSGHQQTLCEPIVYRIGETIVLEPLEAAHVKLKTSRILSVNHPWFNLPGLFEPTLFRLQQGLRIASTIIYPTDRILCSIINNSSNTIKIHNGQTIGQYNPFQLVDTSKSVLQIDNVIEPKLTPTSYLDTVLPNELSSSDFDDFLAKSTYDHLTVNEKLRLKDLLLQFSDVFSNPKTPFTYVTTKYSFHVDTQNRGPIALRPYRVSPREKEIIEKEVDEMLRKQVIEPSSSAWAFPVVLIPKPDGSIRFCVDYRKLNDITVKDKYPLPRIDDLLDAVQGQKLFSTLDCAAGYWQIPCPPKERDKLAFVCHKGLFHFTRMPFGVCNAPSVFQRTMDEILAGLKWVICLVYIDDIIVFSHTFDEHLERLTQIFTRFRSHTFRFKLSKCSFLQQEIDYLGHTVDEHTVKLRRKNLKSIQNLTMSTEKKDVRTFLGLTGYYRRFVKDYARIAQPLHFYVSPSGLEWNSHCEQAWKLIRDKLCEDPVLQHPNFDQVFKLQTDASHEGVGCVLSQEDDKGVEYAVGFASKAFHGAELNWHTQEKEAYAILFGVEYFRPYLYGRPFIVQTDHQSLKWLFNITRPGKLSRWALTLSEYDFTIQHKPGKQNANADALSRMTHLVNAITVVGHEISERDRISLIQAQDSDVFCTAMKLFLQSNNFPNNISPALLDRISRTHVDYTVYNDILHKRFTDGRGTIVWRIVVPPALLPNLISRIHSSLQHVSWKRTYQAIKQHFVSSNLQRTVRLQIQRCVHCQQSRPGPVVHQGLTENVSPQRPWQYVGIDVVGPLPRTNEGFEYLLTCVDWFTGWPEVFPMRTKTASEISRILYQEIFVRHGIPDFLISDNAAEFHSELLSTLQRRFNYRHKFTTPYHPQGNATTERFHRFLKQHMNSSNNFVTHTNWVDLVSTILMAYRTTIHDSTGETPYFLMHGRDMRTPMDLEFGTWNTNLSDPDVRVFREKLLRQQDGVIESANQQRRLHERYNTEYRNQNQRDIQFQVGDLVYLYEEERILAQRSRLGLESIPAALYRWTGPWRILRQTSTVNYVIRHLGSEEERSAHVQRLQLARF